ncbi:MAG: DUF2383 domain-containing protein, partial [Candidatus Binatia bacterium]
MAISRDLDLMNSFLRGELSAVETYDQALDKLSGETQIAATLRDCRDSHALRAKRLREEIVSMG